MKFTDPKRNFRVHSLINYIFDVLCQLLLVSIFGVYEITICVSVMARYSFPKLLKKYTQHLQNTVWGIIKTDFKNGRSHIAVRTPKKSSLDKFFYRTNAK